MPVGSNIKLVIFNYYMNVSLIGDEPGNLWKRTVKFFLLAGLTGDPS